MYHQATTVQEPLRKREEHLVGATQEDHFLFLFHNAKEGEGGSHLRGDKEAEEKVTHLDAFYETGETKQ
jgi:hypothetical protein